MTKRRTSDKTRDGELQPVSDDVRQNDEVVDFQEEYVVSSEEDFEYLSDDDSESIYADSRFYYEGDADVSPEDDDFDDEFNMELISIPIIDENVEGDEKDDPDQKTDDGSEDVDVDENVYNVGDDEFDRYNSDENVYEDEDDDL